MPDTFPPLPTDTGSAERFAGLLEASLRGQALVRLVLSKPRAADADLQRVSVRPLVVRGEACLSFVYSHRTKDITRNLPLADGLRNVRELVDAAFSHGHLFTLDEEIQLLISRKGKQSLRRAKVARAAPPDAQHDREKHRFLELATPFLAELGVTTAQHQLVPAMARKWKQINKFIEVLDNALASSNLKEAGRLRVVDFGAGKGYLTFAMHHHLRRTLGRDAEVIGVELREDMVRLCGDAARRLGLEGLGFEQGDVRTHAPGAIDVMIALHACDTATDYAIHRGVRAGAAIIMCSPCCHKQIRPQLLSPHPLRPILRHGIHLGQEAEMLTDGLRALLLEAEGYDTQVFEFVALEHTSKNKMILAVRRGQAGPRGEVQAQIRQIKDFYGIREHCLESLLSDSAGQPTAA